MKSKKLISFLCAAAMTVSSFAGLAVTTASAAQTELWSNDFNAMGTGLIIDGVTDNAKTNSDIVPGLTFVTTNRGDGDKGTYQTNDGVTHLNGSYYAIEEKADGDNYLLMSLPVFGDFGTNGRWAHVDFENTYTPTAEDDLILDFDAQFVDGAEKGDTTDRAKSNPILRLGTFDATAKSANAVVIDKDALNLGDDWTHIRVIVSNTSGAKVYVDGEEKAAAAAAAVKSIATIGLYTGGNLAATTDRQNEFADPSLGRTATPIVNVDNFVVYKETAGTATGTSTAPGAQSQGGATIPPTVTEAPVPAAPVLTVPEDADPQVTFDFEKYSLSNSYYMQESEQNITDIEGMNIHFGSKAESSTRAEIVKTAGGNAFQLASGRFCTGARGPRVSFTNPMEVDNNYTVIGFAFKLSAMKNHEEDAKPRLYLIKDEQQTGDDGAGGYRNIAAVLTAVPGETIERNPGESKVDVISKEVTADEWHYAALVVDGTTHRLYVDYDPTAEKLEPDVKADYVATGGNASPMTALPMLVGDIQAPKVSGAETTPAYANVMLDNIVTYQMTGSEPRRALPGIGEAEEQSTPEPTATPEPVKVHKVTVSNNKQVVSYNDADTEAEDPYDAVLVHAAYDTNGRLASVKSYPLTGVTKTVKTFTIPDTDPLHVNDKLMVWDSVKGMVPYGMCEVKDGEAQVTPAPTTTPTPTPGAATPTPGTATPTPGTATPTPGTATPTPGTATPDPNVKAATLGKSAYATRGTDDASKKVVVNDGSKAAENLVSNYPSGANKGAYQGVAVIEFEIPKVDDINKIIGATLTLNLENPSTNSNARAYSVYESNTDTPLATGTTYDEIMAKSNGALIYNGANINKGATREDVISNTELLNYVKSKASTTEAKTIQIVVSNSAQGVNVLMSADKAPKLEIETTDKTVYNVPVTYKYGAAGTVYTPAEGDKRPTTVNVIDGDSAAATDEMKAAIVVDGVKYIFDEANTANVLTYKPTAAANTGLVLNFKEATKHTIKLQTKVGDAAATDYQTVANVPEGDKVTVYYPKYLTDAQGKVTAECTATEYQKDITSSATETENTVVVNYTAVTKDMYFVELEEVNGYAKATGDNQFSSKMSKGYGADVKDKVEDANAAPAITVPASGKYNVTAVTINKNTRKDRAAVAIYKNDAAVAANKLVETIVTASCNAPATVTTTAAVDLAANEKIILLDAGPTTDDNDNRMIVDYVLLEKTADSTATPAPTAEPTAEPTATPAPTFDDPTVATGNDANDTYTATAAAYADGTVTGIAKTAKVTVADAAGKTVAWSQNGAGTWGNWVGFTVAVGTDYEITGIAKGNAVAVPATWAVPGEASDPDTGDSKSLVGYYVDASKEVTDKYFFVKVKKGDVEKVYCYEIDVTDVNAKASAFASTLSGDKVSAEENATFLDKVHKNLADLVGGNYKVTVGADKTITVTGDLKYVEDYSEMFGGDEASGTYIPLKITELKDNAVVYVEGAHATGSAPAGVTGVGNKKFNKADKTNFDILKADDNTLYIVFRYVAPAEGEFAKTIIIDQDGDEAGYTPTVYTLKFNGTAQTGNPVAAKPDTSTTLTGDGAGSNVIGDLTNLPDNTTVKNLGTVTVALDSKKPATDGFIYYKATGESTSVAKDNTAGNYAAVTLKAPTDEVKGVIVKGYADVDTAEKATFGNSDVTTLTTATDVTAVLKLDDTHKVYAVAYVEPKAASLDSVTSDTYQQVGKTLIIDFTGATITKAGEPSVPTVEKGTINGTALKDETPVTETDIFPEGLKVNINNTDITVSGQYKTTYKRANGDEGVFVGVVFKPSAEDEKILGSYVSAAPLANPSVEKPDETHSWSMHNDDGKVYGYWPDARTTIGERYVYLLVQKGTDDGTKKVFSYKVTFNVTKKPAVPTDVKSMADTVDPDASLGGFNVNDGSDMASDYGTFTVEKTDTEAKFSGTANKVTIKNGHGEGYFVPVKLTIPADNKSTASVKWVAKTDGNTPSDTDYKPYTPTTDITGVGRLDIVTQVYNAAGESQNKVLWFKVDLDGDGVEYSETTYKFTFDNVTMAKAPATEIINTGEPAEGKILIGLAADEEKFGTDNVDAKEYGKYTLSATDGGATITGTAYNHTFNGTPGLSYKDWYLPITFKGAQDAGATLKIKSVTYNPAYTGQKKYPSGDNILPTSQDPKNEFTFALCLRPVDTLYKGEEGVAQKTDTIQSITLLADADGAGDDYSEVEYTLDLSKIALTYGVTTELTQDQATTKGGWLEIDKPHAKVDEQVKITVHPEDGYKLSDAGVTVTGVDSPTKGTDSDNTTYTFTMPAKNVTVSATFEKKEAKIDYSTWVKNGDDVAHNEDENLKLGQVSSASNPAEGTEQNRNKTDEMTLVKLSGLSTIDKERLVSATLVASMASASYDNNNNRWGDSQIAIGVLTDNSWTEESTYSDIESAIPSNVIAGPWTPTKKTQAQGEDANGPFDTANIDITKQIKEAEGDELSIMLGLFTTRSQLIQKSSLQLNIVQGQKVDFNVTAAVGGTEIDDAVIEIKTAGGESKTAATLTTAGGGKASTALEAGSYTYTVTSKDYKIKTDGTLTVSEEDVTENVSLAAKTPTTLKITSPESTVVSLDTTVQFTATVKDDDGREMTAEEAPVTWSIVNSPANITVVNGLVSATEGASGGSYQVKAELTSNGEVNDTADFTVNLSSPATLTVIYTTGTDDNGKVGEVEVYGADDSKFVNDALTEDELAAYKVPYVKKNSDSDYSVYAYKSIGVVPSQLVADTKVYITVEEPETYLLYNECNVEGASPSWWTDKSRTTAAWGSGTIKQSSENPTSYVIITNGNGQSGGVYDAITQDTTDKIVNVSFDYYLSARTNIFSVRGGTWDNGDRAFKDDKRAFSLDSQTAGQLKVVGGSSTSEQVTLTVNNSDGDPNKGSAESWIHVTAAIDCKNHTTNIKIYKYKADGNYTSESAIYENASLPFRDSSISNLTGFEYVTTSNGGQVAIDNLAVKSITDAE